MKQKEEEQNKSRHTHCHPGEAVLTLMEAGGSGREELQLGFAAALHRAVPAASDRRRNYRLLLAATPAKRHASPVQRHSHRPLQQQHPCPAAARPRRRRPSALSVHTPAGRHRPSKLAVHTPTARRRPAPAQTGRSARVAAGIEPRAAHVALARTCSVEVPAVGIENRRLPHRKCTPLAAAPRTYPGQRRNHRRQHPSRTAACRRSPSRKARTWRLPQRRLRSARPLH